MWNCFYWPFSKTVNHQFTWKSWKSGTGCFHSLPDFLIHCLPSSLTQAFPLQKWVGNFTKFVDLWDMRHEKTVFKVCVLVITNEVLVGWGPTNPSLGMTLTIKYYFPAFIHYIPCVVGVIPKEGSAGKEGLAVQQPTNPSLGMTTTKTLRSVFSWCASWIKRWIMGRPRKRGMNLMLPFS